MKVCAMRPNFAFAALYLLNGHVSLAAPSAKAQNLTVDLGYEVYRGAYDSTTQLDIWRGYVKLGCNGYIDDEMC